MATVAMQEASAKMSNSSVIVGWVLRLIAAVILLQTLFFKFTGAPESVYIFTKLSEFLSQLAIPLFGANVAEMLARSEAFSRVGSGVMELVASILLILPRYPWAGAVLALAATGGAMVSHLTFLGIEVQGDHGLLFGLAITVVLCSLGLLSLYRSQMPIIGSRFQ
jgi:putative oxidoreductase